MGFAAFPHANSSIQQVRACSTSRLWEQDRAIELANARRAGGIAAGPAHLDFSRGTAAGHLTLSVAAPRPGQRYCPIRYSRISSLLVRLASRVPSGDRATIQGKHADA